jgi:hypothetical protein
MRVIAQTDTHYLRDAFGPIWEARQLAEESTRTNVIGGDGNDANDYDDQVRRFTFSLKNACSLQLRHGSIPTARSNAGLQQL